MPENAKKSSAGMIFLAWLLVGLPLGWGVYNTLLNSIEVIQSAGGHRRTRRSNKVVPVRYAPNMGTCDGVSVSKCL